jgi:hypothetical protein
VLAAESVPPPYFANGWITSFPLTTTNATGTYDLAQLYGELAGEGLPPNAGIEIPDEFFTPGVRTSIVVPAFEDAGVDPVVETPAIFQAGGTKGELTWYMPATFTASVSLEGSSALTFPVSCVQGEATVLAQTIVPANKNCNPPDAGPPDSGFLEDGGLWCPAANVLEGLGLPLAECAANNCCTDLGTCVSDDTSLSGCGALAECFVFCEEVAVQAAGGDAAAGTNDIFTCLSQCSCEPGTSGCCATGSPGCGTPAPSGAFWGGLSTAGGATLDFETALSCAQGNNPAHENCTAQ